MRLGIAPPTAPDSPAPRGIPDALCTRTLSSSEVEGLDARFPAFNGRARELFREDSYDATLSAFWLIHLCNIGP
jgi:hypothetical protein